jgi:hypothetical protein
MACCLCVQMGCLDVHAGGQTMEVEREREIYIYIRRERETDRHRDKETGTERMCGQVKG